MTGGTNGDQTIHIMQFWFIWPLIKVRTATNPVCLQCGTNPRETSQALT